jgi:hypothetical protein
MQKIKQKVLAISAFTLALVLLTSAYAEEDISDAEIGIISCVENTTQFDKNDSSVEKEKLINMLFKKANLAIKYSPARHNGAGDTYKAKEVITYFDYYTLCDSYLYEKDPGANMYYSDD